MVVDHPVGTPQYDAAEKRLAGRAVAAKAPSGRGGAAKRGAFAPDKEEGGTNKRTKRK